ncbi:MAG: class I SAM-dependent methyltransferase [Proteobacteria bacterium]|nr:class I SAM-dependent methyltransferase [Pseudomonadota bacterium]MDA0952051.1 class I SAM-dependent methyltransferase [Pseudomonadota bacterium]
MSEKTIDLAGDAFVSGAYALKGAEDAQSFYRLWADDYEDHMVGELGYVSPRLTAQRLTRHLRDTRAEVLDIGCGTGLTCDHLHEQGFDRLDGVDLTPAMLAKSAARGIYRRLIRADLTLPIDLPDASYDAMVSSGTFTCGHVGPEPFDELVRLLRPGGLMSLCIHRDIWEPQGFAARLGGLVDAGRLVLVEESFDAIFAPLPPSGLFLVYRRV